MADAEPDDLALKKGTAELLVLAQLEGRPRHGYEIAQRIADRSDGAVSFQPASLYPVFYRLERRGFIAGRWVEKAGQRRRRYYRLTVQGRRSWRNGARVGTPSYVPFNKPRGFYMRDFKAFVREHVAALGLPPDREQKIVDEWAAELEETYDGLLRRRPLGRGGVARDPASDPGRQGTRPANRSSCAVESLNAGHCRDARCAARSPDCARH